MNKLLFFFLVFGAIGRVFAAGTQEEWQRVSGLENWHHEYDISELRPDNFNMAIRAKDSSGNVSIAGPINFRVDPTSDIPTLSISSPTPGQRSTGNINVVGTAFDDDAVDFVEVQLGEEGEILRAQGQRYWSYFLSLGNLGDGVYSIRARVTDIKGKVSEWTQVSFNLDQVKPILSVQSHPLGALVSGRINLEGTITEPNGIVRVYASLGNQDNFREISFQKIDDQGRFRFHYEIDTTQGEDGPNIVWLKGVNSLANIGISSFLYFADNAAPTMRFLFPAEDTELAGFVPVTGAVLDGVGLENVSWESEGNIRGELELIPGNPYFFIPLTYANQQGRKRVRFTLRDRIGNVRSFEHFLQLNQQKDRPNVTAEALVGSDGRVRIVGHVRDDDGVQSIGWSLGGNERGEEPTRGAFAMELPVLPVGERRLNLIAKDINGVESQPLQLTFIVPPTPPVWEVSSIAFQYGGQTGRTVPYQPGMFLPVEGQNERVPNLVGRVVTNDNRLGEVIYTVQGGRGGRASVRSDNAGGHRFEIPLTYILRPASGNVNLSGPLTVNLSIRGSVGSEVSYSIFLLRDSPEAGAPGTVVFRQGLGSPDLVRVTQEHPFTLVVAGAYERVQVQPPSAAVVAEAIPLGRVTWVRVQPGATPGLGRNLRLLVAGTDGNADLGSFNLASDTTAPIISLSVPEISSWHANNMGVTFTVEDSTPVAALEYAFNDGEFRAVPGVATGARNVSTHLSLAEVSDGPLTLRIRARDDSGNTTVVNRPVFKDTTQPRIAILAPTSEESVNGRTRIVGMVESTAPLIKLEYSENGTVWESMDVAPAFQRFIDFARPNLPPTYRFRATTASGVVGVTEARFTVDAGVDKPVVSVQIPGPAETLRADFSISGLVTDDDAVGAIYVRLNGRGEFRKLDGTHSFSLPVTLDQIEDADHFVEVYAEDINGTRSDVIRQNFRVSRSGPVSQLRAPDVRITQKGRVLLQGTSQDPNGVEALFLSIDNGNTFFRMSGTTNWTYSLDTSLLQDGIYTLLVRAVDTTGASGDYNVLFSVDNAGPSLTLTTPEDGSQVTGSLMFEGRADDNMVLRTLRYMIRPIGAVRPPVSGDFPGGGGLTQRVDISALSPGWYNVSLEATDDAGNVTLVTRNVQVMEQVVADRVELSFPALGQRVSGPIVLMGQVIARDIPSIANVRIGGRVLTTIDVNPQGFFSGSVLPGDVLGLLQPQNTVPGAHQALEIQVEVDVAGKMVTSPPRSIDYQIQGPWIQAVSHKHGDFITNRPYLRGWTGYYTIPTEAPTQPLAEGDLPELPRFGTLQKTLEDIRRNPVAIEISLNNGMSFERVDQWEARQTEGTALAPGDREWRFRLQTHSFPQGPLTVLIRAQYVDGSSTTSRMILVTDTLPPKVSILAPEQVEGSFNEVLRLAGTAWDESQLTSVDVMLHRGRFTPPGFIEGLYVDGYAFGATMWNAGLGLIFFQQAVRLQAQTGFSAFSEDNSRFFGYAHAVKLMARVFNWEWSSVIGPDAEGFSTNVLIGANFTYFTQSVDSLALGQGVILTSFLAQLELLQIRNREWSFFNGLGFYAEVSGWIVSSDVNPTVIFRYSFGARMNLWNQVTLE